MPPEPRPRVLCVDDNEDSRVMLIALMRHSLIEAKAVGTAAEAMVLMQTERFDLYLLDARLPDVDGFELCRQMRNSDPHTPILFFSGAAYERDKVKGIAAGANAYVVKPDIAGLVGTVTHYVSASANNVAAEILPSYTAASTAASKQPSFAF
jgi:DNA-binding response OmpR family regulator